MTTVLASAPLRQETASHTLTQSPSVSLGACFVWSVPLAAVMTVEGTRLGGFSFTGWLWIAYLVAGSFLWGASRALHRAHRVTLPLIPWMVWLGWVWLSLVWCSSWGLRNFQDAVQISSPLLIGAVSSTFMTTPERLDRLLTMFSWAGVAALGLWACTRLGVIGNAEDAGRGIGMVAALAGAVMLAGLRRAWYASLAGWGVCLGLTAVTGSRMATFALLLLPVLHPLVKSATLKLGLAATMGLLGLAAFYSPIFQERFFVGGSGTLTDVWQGDFLSFGRFETWPDVWEEAWKRPWLGGGTGSAAAFVPTVWDGVSHVHNDYLRAFFDWGGVGLALFIGAVALQILRLRRIARTSEGVVQQGAAAALLFFYLFLTMCVTDNPLIYNLWFTNPMFAVLGAVYGARSPAIDSADPARTTTSHR